ncbi:MAG: hypothetical protein H6839_12180 [Planctomycetes bacterium]|nr:hypothetical protein [Planctomycetota bacterium]
MSITQTGTIHDDVRRLVDLEPNEDPVVSCYLDLRPGAAADWRGALVDRFSALRRTVDARTWQTVRQSFDSIRAYLCFERDPAKQGVAVFSRGGEDAFFLARQFDTPVPTSISVDAQPDIYHLIEMKESFHRYIVVVLHSDRARVLEVNLGEATLEALKENAASRDRVAQELTHTHYARHGNFSEGHHVLEIAEVLDSLVSHGGHKHLLLAGDSTCIKLLEEALPRAVADDVSEILYLNADGGQDVVSETIRRYIEHIEDEAERLIDVFRLSFYRNELALAGADRCLAALHAGKVDTLLIAPRSMPPTSWKCDDCASYVVSLAQPHSCRECGSTSSSEKNTLNELSYLAETTGAGIEVVRKASLLDRIGGVGALLRWT